MTIDEAISHAREVAVNESCEKCAEEHNQLAEWLEELKTLRYWNENQYQQIRADAIDDFANWLPKHFDLRFSNNPKVWIDEYFNHTREKILEQLKEQNNEFFMYNNKQKSFTSSMCK